MRQSSAALTPAGLALAISIFAGVTTTTAGLAPDAALAASQGERWSDAEKATLGSMMLSRLPAPPTDPSNAVEGRPEAVALGERLFSDTRLSKNGLVACASCHDPARGFQDGRPVGQGVSTGLRRTMPIAGAAYSPWLFWDGRKDSLWSQALGPLEDAAEHGDNRTRLVWQLRANYRTEYEQLFGPFPSLQGVPNDAGPFGTPLEREAWARLSSDQRDAVNRAFANLGKAIAAYERTVSPAASRFDHYVTALLAGDTPRQQSLTRQEVNGLRLFIGKGQCATCHNGPLLTDQHFHNTGVPQREPPRPDRGRSEALAKVLQDEFNCLGKYSDAAADACQEIRFIATDDPGMEGAFKTPSLRGVAERAPFMHAGQIASLEEVVLHYGRSPRATVGHSELAPRSGAHSLRRPIRLSDPEARDIVAFLRTLSASPVQVQAPAVLQRTSTRP
ncbi:cytochrome-c peroxidase [Paucibacter sp. M5-1]|uniref:cytochrome-c peroxidase n=1 Tax=Paucibacter sp. M5-1 TaxID=3015998 RepID=UPI0022B859D5|nr:cytochrome c peroxidase [Paucibacter sp. M5-1]MCZ7880507.1 cytochrome-c peroxidase [Paucibacter sp. M5-1]